MEKIINPNIEQITPGAPEPVESSIPRAQGPQETDSLIAVLRTIKRPLTSAPTRVPRNLLEQFELYDTGGVRRIYFYVGGVWRYATLT